ncbi:MAG: hypothetical protein KBT03_07210 [Bacteroidales bacterium]|nr:hypothetical protein [Candidatus Scybalousia scybalohippi]
MIVENKVLEILGKHPKEFTSPLFRMTQAKLEGYDVDSFRKMLHVMKDNGLITYVPETKYSLPYWEIKR